jgi:hypothetical protein
VDLWMKFASAAICVRLLEPDLGELPDKDFDWCHGVYGNVEELVPKDAPKPLGEPATTITYTAAWLAFTVRNYGYGTENRNLRFWTTVTRYGRNEKWSVIPSDITDF